MEAVARACAVMPPDRLGRRFRRRSRGRQASAMPRTTLPPMIGETPTTGACVCEDRLRGCRAPTRSCRWRRPGSTARRARGSAPTMASTTPRCGRCALNIPLTECDGGQRRAIPRPPLLEVQLALAVELVGVGDAHVRVDLGVGGAGMSRTPSGQRAWRRVATCDGVAPSRSQAVRARCVPRSRSPSVNHGHPTPHSRSSAATRSVYRRGPSRGRCALRAPASA